jgi:hypothetical protein
LAISQNKKSVQFGIKGGVNFSDIRGQDGNGDKSGYSGTEGYAGFFADTQLKGKFHFRNELIVSFTDDYTFLEVPLLLRYQALENWSFMAGPNMTLLFNDDINVNEPVERKTFGLGVDGGIQFKLGKRSFLETRYTYGLISQINELPSEGDLNGENSILNGKRSTLRVGFGYKF